MNSSQVKTRIPPSIIITMATGSSIHTSQLLSQILDHFYFLVFASLEQRSVTFLQEEREIGSDSYNMNSALPYLRSFVEVISGLQFWDGFKQPLDHFHIPIAAHLMQEVPFFLQLE